MVTSVFKEKAGYRIAKACLLDFFKLWVAHDSLAVSRMALIPTKASVKRWKTARKKRPTQAPNVAAVELGIQDENQSMSIPTIAWKGIIAMTGRVTFVPDDIVIFIISMAGKACEAGED